jgi:Kdo2-lipid IVA lauroyltransferase/acyltransferase
MIIHRLQAWALRIGVRLVQALGPVAASNAGGWVLRTLGPYMAASRVANANLQMAMPQMVADKRAEIVRGVWDNFGRTAAELPHLAKLQRTAAGPGWEIEGEEHLRAVQEKGGPAIFFSAHIANWELIGPAAAAFGVAMAGFYRAASNPLADTIIQDLRRDARGGDVAMFAKGSSGAREAMAYLKRGGVLGMMVDQKMNDGIPVSFFGRDAMTAPALAHLAARFRCPVIPIHAVRLGPARFRVVCEAPLAWTETGDRNADAAAFTLRINQVLETWIRSQPEAWLWLHRRWPKAA